MQEYKVLKKFGDFKKGDVSTFEDMPAEDVAELLNTGKIEVLTDSDEDEEEADEDTASGDSVTVVYGQGERVYSKELHGKEYKKLAQQFAEKFNGTIA